jgi:hypothetical protein
MKKIGAGLMGLVLAALIVTVIVQNQQLNKLGKESVPEVPKAETVPEEAEEIPAIQRKAVAEHVAEPFQEPVEAAPNATVSKEQMAAMGKMFKNPAMKEVMRASVKGSLEVSYGALFTYLNLSAEDEEFLKNLLADRQLALMQVGLGSMDASIPKEERDATAMQQKEMAKAYEEQIGEFLGEEKFDAFTQYENTQPERMLVSMYSQSIEGEYQLTEDQEHDLIMAMYEEREKFPFTTVLADKDNADMSKITEAAVEAHFREIVRLEELYLERAREFLDEERLAAFSNSMKQQRAVQEASLRMASQLFSGSAASDAVH